MTMDLARRYLEVRAATEALAAPLSVEDQQLQSMPDCSPTKWHRAHTTWFFEEFVLGPRGVPPHDPRYRFLFNSYYEAVGPRHPRPRRGMLSRPSCEEIAAYRRAVDGLLMELLESDASSTIAPLVRLGLAHEEQHQELLLTDIKHALFQNPLRPAYRAPRPAPPSGAAPALRFVEHPGGLFELGDAGDGHAFHFDNERPRHRVWLEPFALASRVVTWGEVRAFIEDRGYDTPSLWLSEGLDFVRQQEIRAPLYAEYERGSLRVFTHEGMRDADEAAPAAHLSYYEADAIARFLGGRLPTEAELEAFAVRENAADGNFVDSGALMPRPSDGSTLGLYGDVWTWTSSAYAPYPGFVPGPGAIGEYNGKFMVNQLVLRGGSCLTPRGHVSATYRNFWHPHTRFQMSGARVAKSSIQRKT